MLKKLQTRDDRPILGGGNEILDEREITDVLLDEQILHDDSQEDLDTDPIALESHHNGSH